MVKKLITEARLRDVYTKYNLTDDEKTYFNKVIEKQKFMQKYMPQIVKFVKQDGEEADFVLDVFNTFENYKDKVEHKDFLDEKAYPDLYSYRAAVKNFMTTKRVASNPIRENVENGLNQFSTTTYLVKETDNFWLIYIGSFPASVYFCTEPRKVTGRLGGSPWCIGANESNYNGYHDGGNLCFIVMFKDTYDKSTIYYANRSGFTRTDIMNHAYNTDAGTICDGVYQIIKADPMVNKLWDARNKVGNSIPISFVSSFVLAGMEVSSDKNLLLDAVLKKHNIQLNGEELDLLKRRFSISATTVLNYMSEAPTKEDYWHWVRVSATMQGQGLLVSRNLSKLLYNSKVPFSVKKKIARAPDGGAPDMWYRFSYLIYPLNIDDLDSLFPGDLLSEFIEATTPTLMRNEIFNWFYASAGLEFSEYKKEELIGLLEFIKTNPSFVSAILGSISKFSKFTVGLLLQAFNLLLKKEANVDTMLDKLVPSTEYETKILEILKIGSLSTWKLTKEQVMAADLEVLKQVNEKANIDIIVQYGLSQSAIRYLTLKYPKIITILKEAHKFLYNTGFIGGQGEEEFITGLLKFPPEQIREFNKAFESTGYSMDNGIAYCLGCLFKSDISFLSPELQISCVRWTINSYGNEYFSFSRGLLRNVPFFPKQKEVTLLPNIFDQPIMMFKPAEGTANFKKILANYEKFLNAIFYVQSSGLTLNYQTEFFRSMSYETLSMYSEYQLTNLFLLSPYLSNQQENDETKDVALKYSRRLILAFLKSLPRISNINHVGPLLNKLKGLLGTEEKMIEFMSSHSISTNMIHLKTIEQMEKLSRYGMFNLTASYENMEAFFSETEDIYVEVARYMKLSGISELNNSVITEALKTIGLFRTEVKKSNFLKLSPINFNAVNAFWLNMVYKTNSNYIWLTEHISLFFSMDFERLDRMAPEFVKPNAFAGWLQSFYNGGNLWNAGDEKAKSAIENALNYLESVMPIREMFKKLGVTNYSNDGSSGASRVLKYGKFLLDTWENDKVTTTIIKNIHANSYSTSWMPIVEKLLPQLKHPSYAFLPLIFSGDVTTESIIKINDIMPILVEKTNYDYSKLFSLLQHLTTEEIKEAIANNTFDDIIDITNYRKIILPSWLGGITVISETDDFIYGIAFKTLNPLITHPSTRDKINLVAIHKSLPNKSVYAILENHVITLPAGSTIDPIDLQPLIKEFKHMLSQEHIIKKLISAGYPSYISAIYPNDLATKERICKFIFSNSLNNNFMIDMANKIALYISMYYKSGELEINKMLMDYLEGLVTRSDAPSGHIDTMLGGSQYYKPNMESSKKTLYWFVCCLAILLGIKNGIDIRTRTAFDNYYNYLRPSFLTMDGRSIIKDMFDLKPPILDSIDNLVLPGNEDTNTHNKGVIKMLLGLEGIKEW
jgi:hypothetical protein